jgi:hypothetical protein
MKTRFFFAPYIQHLNGRSTWQKLFVLTEDGKFYCEYLDYMRKSKVEEQFDFENFKASDYVWGGYQYLTEISLEEAIGVQLNYQANWINRYLNQTS